MAKEIEFKQREPERRCLYKNLIFDYSPCRECAEKWKTTIMVMEMSNEPQIDGMPVFADDVDAYPTGRCIGLAENLFDTDAEFGKPLLMIEKDYQEMIDKIDG